MEEIGKLFVEQNKQISEDTNKINNELKPQLENLRQNILDLENNIDQIRLEQRVCLSHIFPFMRNPMLGYVDWSVDNRILHALKECLIHYFINETKSYHNVIEYNKYFLSKEAYEKEYSQNEEKVLKELNEMIPIFKTKILTLVGDMDNKNLLMEELFKKFISFKYRIITPLTKEALLKEGWDLDEINNKNMIEDNSNYKIYFEIHISYSQIELLSQ